MTFLSFAGKPAVSNIFARIVKKADETISSDSTLSDDAELSIALEINKEYSGICTIFVTSGSIPDFKAAFAIPTGASGNYVIGPLAASNATATQSLTSLIALANDGALQNIIIPFHISMGSTAGNIIFQWAQNTLTASNTTVNLGSSMIIWEEIE